MILNKIFFLIIVVIIIYIFLVYIKENINNKVIDKMEVKFLDDINNEYLEVKSFRHDYQNILISIAGYLEEKDLEGLEEFFYSEILSNNPLEHLKLMNYGMIFNIKLPEIRGLVLSKIYESEKRKISIGVECREKLNDIFVDKVILIRVLGIIIDNAIDGAQESDKPKIAINFEKINNDLKIFVINNCILKSYDKNIYKYGFSSKGVSRGIGLYNLDKLLKKIPNTTLNTTVKSGYFIQEILLGNCLSK